MVTQRKGYSHHFFQKITVSSATFLTNADVVINIPGGIKGFSLSNETASSVVEVSYGGEVVNEELDSTLTTKFVQYDFRPGVSTIWLRKKSGSNATVAIRAWG